MIHANSMKKIHDDNFICNIEENSINSVKIGFLGIFWYHYSESYVFVFFLCCIIVHHVKLQDQIIKGELLLNATEYYVYSVQVWFEVVKPSDGVVIANHKCGQTFMSILNIPYEGPRTVHIQLPAFSNLLVVVFFSKNESKNKMRMTNIIFFFVFPDLFNVLKINRMGA